MLRRCLHLSAVVTLAFAAASLPAAAEEPAGPAAIAPAPRPKAAHALLEARFDGWDGMLAARALRVLVAPNQTHFFLDGARQRGIIAEALQELEKDLNRKLGLGARRLHVVPIPVSRGELIPYLEQGRGDVAAANLTITPEREKRVDFTRPISNAIDEVVVTGPRGPVLARLEDLSGRAVHVRRSSSFWTHLEALNRGFEARGIPPVELVSAHEYLETEDLLELTSAGVIPITVADSHLAAFWSDVLPDLEVHEDLKLATGTRIGWAIRKDATGLKAVLDPWIEANRQGRLLGNVLLKRYLRENRWVRASAGAAEEARLAPIFDHFRHYGGRYGFDWMLVAAQGYQESGLDQNKRSAAGAVGVMQLLPSTARDKAVGIPNIDELEPNIHAGTRYLRHIVDTYFDDPAIDESNRLLFAFASYNAGPGKIRRLRREAQADGLDPNRWFGNVELIAARRIGRETAQYVANIYKYYVAFDLIEGQHTSRAAARAALR